MQPALQGGQGVEAAPRLALRRGWDGDGHWLPGRDRREGRRGRGGRRRRCGRHHREGCRDYRGCHRCRRRGRQTRAPKAAHGALKGRAAGRIRRRERLVSSVTAVATAGRGKTQSVHAAEDAKIIMAVEGSPSHSRWLRKLPAHTLLGSPTVAHTQCRVGPGTPTPPTPLTRGRRGPQGAAHTRFPRQSRRSAPSARYAWSLREHHVS